MARSLWYYIFMWEFKRKLLYAVSATIIIVALAIFFLRGILFPLATCSDGRKNGFEVNIDCGGTCALICKENVNPLSVAWAKAIKTQENRYDLAALVVNTNIDNASREIGYTFTVYDEEGLLTKTVAGTTVVPLDGKFPLIVQNVVLPKKPANVAVVLVDGLHYKVTESPTSPTIRIFERRYEAGVIPRVYTTVANTKRITINNLPVRVLLFDIHDNVYAVGQTIIPELLKEGVKEIVFTWDEPLPFPPTRIGVYPIFDPFKALPNY